jgi:hypothetical protein
MDPKSLDIVKQGYAMKLHFDNARNLRDVEVQEWLTGPQARVSWGIVGLAQCWGRASRVTVTPNTSMPPEPAAASSTAGAGGECPRGESRCPFRLPWGWR